MLTPVIHPHPAPKNLTMHIACPEAACPTKGVHDDVGGEGTAEWPPHGQIHL